ncbi:MAG: glycosyl hydrolase family 28 protein [Chthoniobacteraceae bacterium]
MTKISRSLSMRSLAAIVSLVISCASAYAQTPTSARVSITDSGAVGDGVTLNTGPIQSAIDQLASKGGGTLVIPRGVFVSGALFLKPGVHLKLEKDAVLKCSTDLKNFPAQRTRIEGHFEDHFNPALINADGCDGLQITGEGTLDGDGKPVWDQFLKAHEANKAFKNLDLPRARLALIENSRNVVIDGITFKDSQYWNLHLYHCHDVEVKNARFEVPDNLKCPSTDGTDVDSCQNVSIHGCTYRVNDDCICLKGSKGPDALADKASPPVEHIRVSDCTFERGNGVVTLGSEATTVRDVVVENCKVTGSIRVACLKLRGDTPQDYEDIHYRNLTLDGAGPIVDIQPWKQYYDLKGQQPPKSTVRNITLSGIKGKYGSFGIIRPNPGQTTFGDIVLENFDVQLKKPDLVAKGVGTVKLTNVLVNGAAVAAPSTQ